MRVISGTAGGRKLSAPKSTHTRPTTDKVKQAIFNVLGYIDEDSKVLDLYAGTGGIGIEFLSRGAKESVFVDNNLESVRYIKDNVNNCKFNDVSRVYKQDVIRAIYILYQNGEKFDYIFLDPPYEKGHVKEILDLIEQMDILNENGIIIAEHEKKFNVDEYEMLELTTRKEYGDIAVSFLEKI